MKRFYKYLMEMPINQLVVWTGVVSSSALALWLIFLVFFFGR
jgi:hypothetical protein